MHFVNFNSTLIISLLFLCWQLQCFQISPPHCRNVFSKQGFLNRLPVPSSLRCMRHSQTNNEPPHDKINKMTVRPAKTQISLGIHLVRSESSLCVQWVDKDPSFPHADSEDSDQTGRMPRLIWVFDGRTCILLVLSRGGSNVLCPWDFADWTDA